MVRTKADKPRTSPMTGSLLQVESLTRRFGDLLAVSSCSLNVAEGEIVVIIGPSGCGKTTFLRCINHLIQPTSGTITLRGETIGGKFDSTGRWLPCSKVELARQRGRIGFVFQRINLFNHLSALDNVTIGPRRVLGLSKQEAEAIGEEQLRRVFLVEHIHKKPSQLSGGQQQRVAIARSLAMKPDLILFDEPTSALDPELVTEVLDVMGKLARERMTMIVVSHDMNFARQVANRVILMDSGIFVEEGPPDQMFSNPREDRTRRFLSHLIH